MTIPIDPDREWDTAHTHSHPVDPPFVPIVYPGESKPPIQSVTAPGGPFTIRPWDNFQPGLKELAARLKLKPAREGQGGLVLLAEGGERYVLTELMLAFVDYINRVCDLLGVDESKLDV